MDPHTSHILLKHFWKTLDCEQSLFSQSSLSSAGLERANWPRGLASLDFLARAFFARVTILRDCSQSRKTQDKVSDSANTCIASLSQVCLVINVCKINIEGEKQRDWQAFQQYDWDCCLQEIKMNYLHSQLFKLDTRAIRVER